MKNSQQIFVFINAMSIEELQFLQEATSLLIQQKMKQKTIPKSANPIVNEILTRSLSMDPLLNVEFEARFGYNPYSAGYHDTNPNNPFKDYNKSSVGNIPREWPFPFEPGTPVPLEPSFPNAAGYHDTNPNNPFKDYNKSSGGGYTDSNPNNPFKDTNRTPDNISSFPDIEDLANLTVDKLLTSKEIGKNSVISELNEKIKTLEEAVTKLQSTKVANTKK